MEATHIVSEDAASVRETLDLVYPGCIVGRMPAGRAQFEWSSLATEDVTLVDYSTTTPLRLEVEMDPLWSVARVRGAGVRGSIGGDALDTRGAVLFPPDPLHLAWHDMHTTGATFDGAKAQQIARLQSGNDGLVLRPRGVKAISTMHEDFWWSTWRQCRDALLAIDGEDAPLVEVGVRSQLTSAALYAFPTTLSELRAHGRQAAAPGRRVRQAMAYIDENAARPIDVADIARAVGMSGRGLRAGFLRAGLDAPELQLRRARLAGARREILAADASVTVAQIARRWGFARPRHFLRLYRAEFGVLPGIDDRGV